MTKPLNATILRHTTEYERNNIIDARVVGDRSKFSRRFVQNDDGTWSTWAQTGAHRRIQFKGAFYFRFQGGHLYPMSWQDVDNWKG